MLTVHLRITDTATGDQTPARICVSGADGSCFAPLGQASEFPVGRNEYVGGQIRIGRERWYYIDGACEIPLPAGVPIRIRASKGPEYSPIDSTVTLGPGQMTVRFALERIAASDARIVIDTRCHFLPPHAAALEAAGEGLAVVNLLAAQKPLLALDGNVYETVPNLIAFSGQVPALQKHGSLVFVNTFNEHPVLGKVALLHSHRPVFPLTFGGDDGDDWSICDWCDQCHRKGGLTIWVDAFEPTGGIVGGEALVAALLGKIDAIELTNQPRNSPLLPWLYRLWDAGFLIPLAGASGKDSNATLLGAMRTVIRNESGSWLDAIRAGESYVTAGPMLDYARDRDRVTAAMIGQAEPARLELVVNGRVHSAGERRIEAIAGDAGWASVRCHDAAGLAHSSPIRLGSRPRDPEAVEALKALVAISQEWIETQGRFRIARRKAALLERCEEALTKLDESS